MTFKEARRLGAIGGEEHVADSLIEEYRRIVEDPDLYPEDGDVDAAARQEVASWDPNGWDGPAINAGAARIDGVPHAEALERAYYAAYERAAQRAQAALDP